MMRKLCRGVLVGFVYAGFSVMYLGLIAAICFVATKAVKLAWG